MRNTTMKEVAACAEVSVATVSHVINGSRYVSEETRRRVEDAIKKLSYTPNVAARSFKSGKKNILGFVVPDIANQYFSAMVETFEDTISCYGYSLILTNTRESIEREFEHIRNLCSGMVGGLAIASTAERYSDLETYIADVPSVFVDRELPGLCRDTITLNNDALHHGICDLLKSGHTRIGYIAGLERLNTTRERVDVYKRALVEHNLEVDESLIAYANSMSKSAVSCVKKLLQHGCTSFIVSNNIMTSDTLSYLQKHAPCLPGTSTPFHILGYSTENWPNISSVSISSIVPPAKEIGRIAGEMLIKRIEEPNLPLQNIKLDCDYIP